nr:MOSC domain-containing protein [uncultured Dongia sp.]
MSGVAKVAGLYRYPVQSVPGEELAGVTFGPKGIPGDRGFVIADLELGVVAHVSRAKKQYRDLFQWRARYLSDPQPGADLPLVELDFGDGTVMRSDDRGLDQAISDRLGMKAAFARNDGSIVPLLFEPSHCHLLTSATLKRLQQNHETGIFVPARFRPNIFLDCGEEIGFVEQDWLGRKLSVGDARFDINDVCKRCALTTRAQGDLPSDPGILQATAQNKTVAGVYGSVIGQGTVATGDVAMLSA